MFTFALAFTHYDNVQHHITMEKWKIPLDSLPWTTSNKHSIKNSSTFDVVLQQKNKTDALFIESIYLCVADEIKTRKKSNWTVNH